MIQPRRYLSLLAAIVVSSLCHVASADEGLEFFEKRIRPALVQHCYKCHSTQSPEAKGKLLLDTREAIRKGGESGPAVVPGKPEESWLLAAIAHDGTFYDMPPSGKLPAPVIADFRRWIEIGAPDPRDKPAGAALAWEQVLAGRKNWWSLQPVKNPPVPEVRNAAWSTDPIDRFLLAKLEAAGLEPTPPADPRALVRRLSFVLTGLPPKPEEVEGFVRSLAHSQREKAYESLVDRLLASPHLGERWARHWMDVVRFGETHGYEWNFEIRDAWRYRDYLIRAFNQDVPFDQLIREHIAGDLLSSPRWNLEKSFNESLLGTCFYRFGEVSHDCYAFRETSLDVMDNQLDTLTKAFQATTVACARCHDHKLDAVSMKDYYALLGILASSRTATRTIDDPRVNENVERELAAIKTALKGGLAEVLRASLSDLNAILGLSSFFKGKFENVPGDHPLSVWNTMRGASDFESSWRAEVERHRTEQRRRAEFNAANFILYADFRRPVAGWGVDGLGLQAISARSGDFAVASTPGNILAGIYPAGLYTHLTSDRLSGALRSPYMTGGKQKISFRVIGDGSSAVRPVTDNCVIGENYQLLKDGRWKWITLSAVHKQPETRLYYELVTVQDNPRLPERYHRLKEVPEATLAEPHSHFGITQVVLHDCPEPPHDELRHLDRLFADPPLKNLQELGERYLQILERAIEAWASDQATDDDTVWLELVKDGIDPTSASPALLELLNRYRETERRLQSPRVVPAMADIGDGFDLALPQTGASQNKPEVVLRRFLEVLSDPAVPFKRRSGSGRRELAEAIASPKNPLTARVIVNRIWQHVFGTGLVRTPDDFGQMGDLPSHPELLDYLATRFVNDGWSIKRLIRTLVLTRAFQLSSRPSAEAQKVDPTNRLWQHYPARRLEAEAIRDSLLAISGRLDPTLFGPSIQPHRPREDAMRRLFSGPLDGNGRRSIYTKVTLMEGPAFLMAFNFPDAKSTVGRRDLTNVPGQALALLNDPFVIQQAEVWAKRLVSETNATVSARLDRMFLTAFGRPPDASERERFSALVDQLAELHGVAKTSILASEVIWKDVAHALFNLREFVYIY
jgi:hypothetical protein